MRGVGSLPLGPLAQGRGERRVPGLGVEEVGGNALEADVALHAGHEPRGSLGQGGEELALGELGLLREGHDAQAAHEAEADDEGDGLLGAEGHGREEVALAEAKAAASPHLRRDRDAEPRKDLDIAVDGARGHLEALRQLSRGDYPPSPEEEENSHRPFEPFHDLPGKV